MASIRFENVTKNYGDVEVIKGIDIEIYDGEFVVFVGPSGCGKSTLLRMLAGLETADSGSMYIGDVKVNNVAPKKRNIAMVFQNYALYPHMNVAENIGFGLKLRGISKKERAQAVVEAAILLGIEPLLDRKPKHLSGGQRQRVAMGRAIVRKPEVFLMDEPLSNLDAKLRNQMRVEIKRLQRRFKTTTIFVTHDQVEAMTLADRIAVVNDGGIQQLGSPFELYNNPVNKFVAGFLGSPSINFIPAEVCDGNQLVMPDGKSICLMPIQMEALKDCRGVEIGIRPEKIKISKDSISESETVNSWTGDVTLVESLGGEMLVYVSYCGLELAIKTDNVLPLSEGEKIALSFNVADIHLFAEDGGQSLDISVDV